MTKFKTLAALALVAVAASTSLATAGAQPPMQPGPKGPPTPHGPSVSTPDTNHGVADLDCRVKGLDFIIINTGDKAADSGRQVVWASPSTNDGNLILLPKMLGPGDQVKLAGVLTSIPRRGAPCSVGFV